MLNNYHLDTRSTTATRTPTYRVSETVYARYDCVVIGVLRDYTLILCTPRLGSDEFLGLCEMADVVLDPFPVGGGRSSLEIFAVGTPIIMLYNRTSILQVPHGSPEFVAHFLRSHWIYRTPFIRSTRRRLFVCTQQLTYGMYSIMGLEGPLTEIVQGITHSSVVSNCLAREVQYSGERTGAKTLVLVLLIRAASETVKRRRGSRQ